MFCSVKDGSSGRAEQHGMGRAVKGSIVCEAAGAQELTNERLVLMTFNLAGKSNAITFVVAYGPTDTVFNTRNIRMRFGQIWIVLLVEYPAVTICLFKYMLTLELVYE